MNLSKVIGRAWDDPAYKSKLLGNPHAALAEAGVEVPAGIKLKVVEDTADTKYIVLPTAPADATNLTEEYLNKMVAGHGWEFAMKASKIIGRAWADPAYKSKLVSDPHAALTEAGIDVPADIKLTVVEDTADTKYVVLPTPPADAANLTEEDLNKVTTGHGWC